MQSTSIEPQEAGKGAASLSAMPKTAVYVSNSASHDIDVMAFDAATGQMTAIQKVALPRQPGGSTPMALSGDGRFLFVGIRSVPYTVATFAIDPNTGRLTHVGDGPLAASPAYIATDRTGRHLLSASYPGHSLAVNPIGADGVVGPVRQEIGDIPNAHAVVMDASGAYAFVPSLGSDSVRQFRFDALSGTLTPNVPDRISLAAKDGPRHLVFDAAGAHGYLICELSANLVVFDYDRRTGQLAEKQRTSTAPAGEAREGSWQGSDIHITPDGRFVYAALRATSTLSAFRVDPATGEVAPVATYPTEAVPRGFAIDPAGRYLIAAGVSSGHVMSYAIDQETGALSPLARYRVGDQPNWIEFLTLS